MLTGLVVSLIVVADDHFRRGAVLFAAFVVGRSSCASILRTAMPAGWPCEAGVVDLACLGFLGLSLSVFALIVPSPS